MLEPKLDKKAIRKANRKVIFGMLILLGVLGYSVYDHYQSKTNQAEQQIQTEEQQSQEKISENESKNNENHEQQKTEVK